MSYDISLLYLYINIYPYIHNVKISPIYNTKFKVDLITPIDVMITMKDFLIRIETSHHLVTVFTITIKINFFKTHTHTYTHPKFPYSKNF